MSNWNNRLIQFYYLQYYVFHLYSPFVFVFYYLQHFVFRLLSPFVFAARSAILCKLGIVLFQFPHLTFQNFIDIEQASILEYQ